jgi:hypothetical protein
MAIDQPPLNRAQRRAAQHKKGKTTTLVLPQRAPRPSSQSRSADPGPATGTGAPSENDDMDAPEPQAPTPFPAFMTGGEPARPKASHHKGGSKQQRIYEGLVSYYGFAGMLISTRSPGDGMLIAGEAERLASLWLEAGKASPAIMRVLELVTIAGPYTALVFAHGQIALAIMSNHGVSPLSLFARAENAAPSDGQTGRAAQPAPLPYQPAGPFAPTDNAPLPMPPVPDDSLRVYPEEGLPADLDVALRQAARQSGRPYKELREEAMLQLAQVRMAQNGHVQTPGALGAPVAKE